VFEGRLTEAKTWRRALPERQDRRERRQKQRGLGQGQKRSDEALVQVRVGFRNACRRQGDEARQSRMTGRARDRRMRGDCRCRCFQRAAGHARHLAHRHQTCPAGHGGKRRGGADHARRMTALPEGKRRHGAAECQNDHKKPGKQNEPPGSRHCTTSIPQEPRRIPEEPFRKRLRNLHHFLMMLYAIIA